MKKPTRRLREHQIRRARDELRRKARESFNAWLYRERRRLLVFTGDLDLIENPDETRAQLARLDFIEPPDRGSLLLTLDLRGVTDIDACALLHLVAQFDRIKTHRNVRVRGNLPASQAALKVLYEAKFPEYVGGGVRILKRRFVQDDKSLEISRGSSLAQLDPGHWIALHRFLCDHGGLTDEEGDALYQAFGECVENVSQHAFGPGRGGSWYAVAVKPMTNKPARAVVLDLGVGIAGTVRRTGMDQMRGILSKVLAESFAREGGGTSRLSRTLDRIQFDDWMCVSLATQGLRTETAASGRGTGLVGLRTVVLANEHAAMHVLSGTATVTLRPGLESSPNLQEFLRGTIVCLEIGRPALPATSQ